MGQGADSDLDELVLLVPDSYDDFYRLFPMIVRKEGVESEVVAYLREHRQATSSDILRFFREITGHNEPLKVR